MSKYLVTEIEFDADLNKTFGKVEGMTIWVSGKLSRKEYTELATMYFDRLELGR